MGHVNHPPQAGPVPEMEVNQSSPNLIPLVGYDADASTVVTVLSWVVVELPQPVFWEWAGGGGEVVGAQ